MKSHERYADRAPLGADVRELGLIDTTANRINMVLNPIDDIAKKKVVGESTQIVRDMANPGEWQADSVQSLVETVADPNKVANRQVAERRLVVLTEAAYIAAKFGDNAQLAMALESGSAQAIDNSLPDPLKGLGEGVRNLEITNPDIRQVLDDLDKKGRVLKMAGRGGESKLRSNLEGAIEQLSDLSLVTVAPKVLDEVMRVAAYLGYEVEVLESGSVQIESGGGTAVEQYLKAIAEYNQRRGGLETEVEKVSLGELVNAYLYVKAPRERAPQMWEYVVPEFMGGMSQEKWRKLLNFQDAWLGAIYNKRGDSAYNNSLDKMLQGILSMKSLDQESFKEWYKDGSVNLKGVMHQISQELFVKKEVTAVVPVTNEDGTVTSKEVSRTTYVFDTEVVGGKEVYSDKLVQDLVDNDGSYKLALAERLVEKKVVANLEVAKLAVAISMDIMEMGGVFSAADVLRKLSWDSDAVRLTQKPERKYTSKVGSRDLFAGPWTELATVLTHGDPKKAVELIRSWGVVPEMLAGSFMDQKVYGLKMNGTIMDCIYDDVEIPFKESGDDLFFTWRKDHIMTAGRMWMYIANKTPLEFSKNREPDAVVSQWRVDLYQDANQLRNNEDALLPTSVVAGAIGGSAGLWPFEGPYLRINDSSHPDTIIQYSETCTEIVRQLGLREGEQQEIMKFFGVGDEYGRDFNDKMTAYDEFRNVTLPKWYKEEAKKTLFKKRK